MPFPGYRLLLLVTTSLSFAVLSCEAQSTTEKAQALIDAYVKSERANGAVLVAQKGRILFEEGYGYKDIEAKKPNDVHTIFQLGSVTKQFTSAIILQLQAEKRLSTSDRLSKFFPGLPHADSITLENLLTHTSGLFNYTNDADFMKNGATLPHSHEEMLALFRDKPLDFAPGSRWEYSNTNYLLLGYIIEKATGRPYETVVRERILTPLKMNSSGFDFANLRSADKATGYSRIGTHPETAPIVDSTASYAAGALYSTVGDLYKWDRALYTNAILTPEQRAKAFTPVLSHYGYGWMIDSMYGRPMVTHGGGIFGFTSSIIRFPTEETVIILLDNSGSGRLTEMQNKLAAIVFGQPYQLPEVLKEITVDDSTLRSYVGDYEIRPGLVLTISLENGALFGRATGQGKIQLRAETKSLFFVKEIEIKIEFVRDTDGKVGQAVIHQNEKDTPAKRIPPSAPPSGH